jgi:hypothetical protein
MKKKKEGWMIWGTAFFYGGQAAIGYGLWLWSRVAFFIWLGCTLIAYGFFIYWVKEQEEKKERMKGERPERTIHDDAVDAADRMKEWMKERGNGA